jgi:hypothetical protein
MAAPDEIDMSSAAAKFGLKPETKPERPSPPDEIAVADAGKLLISNSPAAPKTGIVEALTRGAGDGITLGFGAKSGLMSRAANKTAQAEHPIAYMLGELLGGSPYALIPGIGMAKTAGAVTKVGRAIAGGAGAGGASGVGHDDTGDTVGAFTKGAMAGAALPTIGGTAGAGGRLAGLVGHYTPGVSGVMNAAANSSLGQKVANSGLLRGASTETGAFLPSLRED